MNDKSVLNCSFIEEKEVTLNSITESIYGLTFKLIKVLVKMPLNRALKGTDESMIDFLDSDSD